MDKLFLTILNMSLTGAFVIAAILLARLPLKKAPKFISYCLWAVAGFRLVFPFSMESVLSLIPFKAQPIPQDIATQALPRIDSGISIVDNVVSAILPTQAADVASSVNPLQVWTSIAAYVWLAGAAIMLIYGIVSYILLKHKMRAAIRVDGDIYEAGNLQSPFVLGIFRPRIYIPLSLAASERGYIILHEQTHIRRRDHIVKFAAYFILCLHWFNPLAWAAFLLMGADMEMSCDERVLKEMGGAIKKAYSLSLLSFATERRVIAGSPLAFGEGGVKERLKNVLNFKKPSRVIIIVAVALVAALSIGFAVNRASTGETARDLQYFDANGFQLGSIIDGTASLTPAEPLAGNPYEYNFAEARYSLDPESGVIRKMHVNLYDTGLSAAFTANPWYTVEEVRAFFGQGKSGWQDKEQGLRYVEYTQKEGRLSATVRFVYADKESEGIQHRLVWVLAQSSLPYPKPASTSALPGGLSRTYYLENATERQKFERLLFVTLCSDGTAMLATPPISSYALPNCRYSIVDDELLIHAAIEETEFDESFYGVKNGDVIARFTIADAETLVFRSATVPLFADPEARYVYTPSAPYYEAREWLNYFHDEQMPWDGSSELELPEYPDTLFQWTPYEVKAIDSQGETILFSGMPIWNVYLADLTGDGLPEFCATASFGSGIVDTRVLVYDYAAGKLYELSDRMSYDYALSMEDGQLILTQTEYNGAKLATGSLAIQDGELIATSGVDRP